MGLDGGSPRPIFVVGCARSGTTLLQLMLHAHPRIAIPPETRFLTEAYAHRDRFGDLRRPDHLDALVDWLFSDPQQRLTRDLGLDIEEFRARAHREEPTLGTILGLVFRMYAERWDKPRWGDKRPSYFQHIDELLSLFPDAQLIHLIRDGRDCVASLKHMPWWSSGSIGAMQNWVAAMRVGARCRRRLRADQYHELYYEDLVADPGTEVARLCAFLDEPFDQAMLEPAEVAESAVPRRKRKRHHARTTQGISDRAVGRWSDDLDPWELDLMEAVAARHLRHHGYRLEHPRRPVPPPLALARYLRRAVRLRVGRLRRRVHERRVARRYPYEVAARLG